MATPIRRHPTGCFVYTVIVSNDLCQDRWLSKPGTQGLDAQGPFNKLVKECLFVHGWNERTERHAPAGRPEALCSDPLCITQNGRIEEKKKKKKNFEGVSGVFRYEGMEQGCQMAKFDPFLSLSCARVEGVGAQSKERKASNFAA